MPNAHAIFTAKHKLSFDFGKMARGSNKVIRETLVKIAKKSVKTSKENIDKGLRPKLKPFTKIMRSKGIGWGGKKGATARFGDKPLKQTGTLYNSIRYNKSQNSLEMKAYGLIQNRGFTSLLRKRARGYAHKKVFKGASGISKEKPSIKFIQVPARPFIAIPSKETEGYVGFGSSRRMTIGREIRKIHYMKMHNALKKR